MAKENPSGAPTPDGLPGHTPSDGPRVPRPGDEARRKERVDASKWRTVDRLSRLPDGVYKIVAQVYLHGPVTLAELYALLLPQEVERAQKNGAHDDLGISPEGYATFCLDDTLLYDVAQLSVNNLASTDSTGRISLDCDDDAVRTFLRCGIRRRHEDCPAELRATLYREGKR